MCKSIPKYNGSNKISTYLYTCFDNAVKMEYRKNKTSKHKLPIVNGVGKNGAICNILDSNDKLLPTNDTLEKDIFVKEIIDKYGNEVVDMFLEGYSVPKISEITGLSKYSIRQKIAKFKLEVEKYYRKGN